MSFSSFVKPFKSLLTFIALNIFESLSILTSLRILTNFIALESSSGTNKLPIKSRGSADIKSIAKRPYRYLTAIILLSYIMTSDISIEVLKFTRISIMKNMSIKMVKTLYHAVSKTSSSIEISRGA